MSKNILIKNEHGYSLELSEWRERYPEFDIFSYYTETYPDIVSIQVNEKDLPGVLYVGGRIAESKCITVFELEHCVVDTTAIIDILIRRMLKDIKGERNRRSKDYYGEWHDKLMDMVTEFRKTDEKMKDIYATVVYDYELWKTKKDYRLEIAEKSHLAKHRSPIRFDVYIRHQDLIDPRFKNTWLKDYVYLGVNKIIDYRNLSNDIKTTAAICSSMPCPELTEQLKKIEFVNSSEIFTQQVEHNINSIPFGFNPTITVKKED